MSFLARVNCFFIISCAFRSKNVRFSATLSDPVIDMLAGTVSMPKHFCLVFSFIVFSRLLILGTPDS